MTEELFKDKIGSNGGPKFSFMDMQLWMYFYGVVLNLAVFFLTNDDFTSGDFLHNMFRELGTAKELLFLKPIIPPDVTWPRWPMMITGIMATAVQGMVVAR